MTAANYLLRAAGSSADQVYVDDVFSTYLYTGNGSTQTITNGIDLAGKGGMVWTKSRGGGAAHVVYDSARGLTSRLEPNTTNAQTTVSPSPITGFNSNGYSLGSDVTGQINEPTAPNNSFVSWTFRRAPKFFDVVTYTTVSGAMTIPHSLGSVPGCWFIKATSTTDSWWVHHRSIPNNLLRLNGTSAVEPGFSTATSTNITISNGVYAAGTQIVIYLFAHDTTTDGIIQCGSFTTDGSGNATVNLGWEPQFVLVKPSSTTGNWFMADQMRDFVTGAQVAFTTDYLLANTSSEEVNGLGCEPTATGFKFAQAASQTYIYLAIRRPNKPPTSGTEVYAPVAYTGNGGTGTVIAGFAPDLIFAKSRTSTSRDWFWADRLRGAGVRLSSNTTGGEVSDTTNVTAFQNTAVTLGPSAIGNSSSETYGDLIFRRAPGVFDIACYTGSGSSGYAVKHNLTVPPELIIIKPRNVSGDWFVGSEIDGTGFKYRRLNTAAAAINYSYGTWLSAAPTADSVFLTVSALNNASNNCVAYLFASKVGISKVSTYTGNGSSQTINCGFTTGARFVLICRIDTLGDWFVWDSARGIVAGNDPRLSLNSSSAEVTTDDSVDPDTSGFIVNQVTATSINATGGTYTFLAFA